MVTLSITCSDCEAPGLSSPYGLPAARIGRTSISDEDRRAVIDALKRAYVDDLISAHELGDRFERAYSVTTLAALEDLLPR